MYIARAFFCLPIRFGIFLCLIAGFLGGSFGAVAGWSTVITVFGRDLNVPIHNRIAIYAQSTMYIVHAIIAMAGIIILALRMRLVLLKVYLIASTAQFILNLGSSIFFSITLFGSDGTGTCLSGTPGSSAFITNVVCSEDGGDKITTKIFLVAFVAVILFFAGYEVALLSSYFEEAEIDSVALLLPPSGSSSPAIINKVRRTSSFHSAGIEDKLRGFIPLPSPKF